MPIAREPLVNLLKDLEPSVQLQAVIALGRIGLSDAIPSLIPRVADTDVFLAFSARQALRRIGDWPRAARWLDSPDPEGPRRGRCSPWRESTTRRPSWPWIAASGRHDR